MDGSIFLVLEFPNDWPVKQEIEIFAVNQNGTEIKIISKVDGSLSFIINGERYDTQIIEFSRAKRALLSLLWKFSKANKIEVYLNSERIGTKDNEEIFLISSNYPDKNKGTSFSDSERDSKCKEWIEWRKHRYKNPKTVPRKDRVIKDIEIQFHELEQAIRSLEKHLEVFKDDSNLLLLNSFPILRSLLFWPDKKSKNYNPLLLRLAGYLELPLPVYAFKDWINKTSEDPLFKDSVRNQVHNYPSIKRRYPNEELMDFQEWLNMEVIKDTKAGEKTIFRWKDIIFDGANTISSSHFDDDVPIFIDNLENLTEWGRSSLFNYLLTIIDVSIIFGKFILENKNSR